MTTTYDTMRGYRGYFPLCNACARTRAREIPNGLKITARNLVTSQTTTADVRMGLNVSAEPINPVLHLCAHAQPNANLRHFGPPKDGQYNPGPERKGGGT